MAPVASKPTAWRVLERVSAAHLHGLRRGRAAARAAASAAGAEPDLFSELCLDIDATIVIPFRQGAGRPDLEAHLRLPPARLLPRPPGGLLRRGAGGHLRAGNAGSNTAAEHEIVLGWAIDSLPEHARPRPGDRASPTYVVRSDSAGATHRFAQACREAGVAFSSGFPVTAEMREAMTSLRAGGTAPARQPLVVLGEALALGFDRLRAAFA